MINPAGLHINHFSSKHGSWSLSIPVGIRVVHVPTGIEVTCEKHRSQHLNKEECLRDLELKLSGQF
jgi:protein subunit release factor A